MNFNKSQSEAIRHKDGPMLVLAGPGSGKTAVITQRTKTLITEYKVRPENILVITFTRAAANEMKMRFEKLMGEKTKVSFGTFHAIFFMILKHAYHFSGSNIITGEQKYQFMREILSWHHLEYQDENEFIGNLFGEISSIKNGQIDLDHYYSANCGEEVFRKIYREYEQRLRKNRLIDYDDMLTYTWELFTQRPDILALWQKKYPYILIDEFQDINRIQYEIVRMLAAPRNNLFIVGDDDQSIYRFRGSKPEIMMNFEKDYPQAKRVLLDINYRCGIYVVETAKNLISHNKERFDKAIIASSRDRTPVSYLTFENRRAENLYILREIERQVKAGTPPCEIAVLFRTNSQPRQLTESLMEYNLPFKIKDQMPNIYEHWIAKDIFTYLRLAGGSRAREDFLQIMNRPKRYIGRDSLCDPRIAFDEWEKMYDEQPWIAERIVKLEADLKMLSKMSPYAAINYIRRGIGYDDFLLEYALYRQIDKTELFDLLDEIQAGARGYKTLEEWQEHIREYAAKMKAIAQAKEENPEAITLATLHSAKGLEFQTVFLLDVNEGLMPYKKAVLEKDLEEERRLFYVGMTRAKQNLFLCSVKTIYDKNAAVSRFVEESKKPAEEKEKA